MHVVKHLYVLTHGSTYCTCGVLTVAPPVGVCAHVLDSYMGMHGPVGVATLVCMGSATDQGFGGLSSISTHSKFAPTMRRNFSNSSLGISNVLSFTRG